jgi:N12 class adenine-specific DNA methylase
VDSQLSPNTNTVSSPAVVVAWLTSAENVTVNHMIEGLKVFVKADELKQLCIARADHHKGRAEHYRSQLPTLDALNNPNSSMRPGEAARAKIVEHEANEAELRFVAEHLDKNETYMLNRDDLGRLGIVRNRW